MDESSHGIDLKRYGLFMYLYRGGTGRNAGLSVRMNFNGISTISTELVTTPFGFVMILNPDRNNLPDCGTEITELLNNHKLKIRGDFLFELPIYEQNSPMPLDFRTRKDILEQVKKNDL
jgi:hypothetical protein